VALASIAQAEVGPFVDAETGIKYQQFTNSDTGFAFAWALPPTDNQTFLGLLTSPIKAGWAGLSFGGNMRNSLLLVAWNNNGNLTGDLRWAPQYSMPKPYQGKTNPVFTPLPCSSYVNATHWALAFTCTGCNSWTNPTGAQKGGFDLAQPSTKFGWAYSDNPVADPADPRTPIMKHSDAGKFNAPLEKARFDKYNDLVAKCTGEDKEGQAEAAKGSGALGRSFSFKP
jgi:cellobiose dehydrogenase (acceptor)